MKKPIIIDNKRFSRVKKLLKKNLENKNLSLSLSESGEILAKALGFTDYHHIEKTNFTDTISQNNILSSYNTKKIYLEYIYTILKKILDDLYNRKDDIINNPHEIESFYCLFYNIRNILSIVEYNKEFMINNAFPVDYFEESRVFMKSRNFYSASRNSNPYFYRLSDELHNIIAYFFLKDREDYYLQPEDFYKETPKIILTDKTPEYATRKLLQEMQIECPFKEINIVEGTLQAGKKTLIKDILKNENTQSRIISYEEIVEFNYSKIGNANFFIYNKNNTASCINLKINDLISWICNKSNKDTILKNDILIYKEKESECEILLFNDSFINAISLNDKNLIKEEFLRNRIIIKKEFLIA